MNRSISSGQNGGKLGPQVPLSQLNVSSHRQFRDNFGSLRSTSVGIVTPWKLENATNQAVFLFGGGSCLFVAETEEVNESSLMSDWTWRIS